VAVCWAGPSYLHVGGQIRPVHASASSLIFGCTVQTSVSTCMTAGAGKIAEDRREAGIYICSGRCEAGICMSEGISESMSVSAYVKVDMRNECLCICEFMPEKGICIYESTYT
jgi:hypothetical protein